MQRPTSKTTILYLALKSMVTPGPDIFWPGFAGKFLRDVLLFASARQHQFLPDQHASSPVKFFCDMKHSN